VSSEKIPPDHARELIVCFTQCAPGLFGYACMLTRGDVIVASDFVQATFTAAAGHWASVRSLPQPQRLGWLRTMVGNRAISAFSRNEPFHGRLSPGRASHLPRPAGADAEGQLAILLDRVWLSIVSLPPQQHAVAALRWLFDMKNGEIAAQLGIADETVAAYLCAVHGRLRSELEPANTPEDELMAHLYQLVTDRESARYAHAYEVGPGLKQFIAWLHDHSDDQAVGTAIRPAADTMPMPALPKPDELGLDADRAVSQLYATHYRALVRLAVLLVRDTPTAEEVVQDAIVATHEGWHRIRDGEKTLAYLRQAVVNRSRSVLRHRTVADKNLQEAPPDMPSAEHGALTLLDRSAVVSALRELPVRQREAIVLRYYADLSEAQIAETMGISKGAVKSHTSRGMSSLRAVLQSQT
jgi:RNA polymerase sigma-70 factor (sigma-E family)